MSSGSRAHLELHMQVQPPRLDAVDRGEDDVNGHYLLAQHDDALRDRDKRNS